MKRLIYSLVLSFFCFFSAYSQTIIQMEEYNGVFRIPCIVNGAKMKFIFDTGASTVCISMTMAEYLLDNGYITKEDIIGSGSSTVADGRIVDHVVVNLKDIEIQGIHLYNIKSVVVEGQNAPLLMGQSAIQKLGAIEINGSVLTIKSGNELDDAALKKIFEEAKQAMDNHLYELAIEKYSKLYAMNELSVYGIYNLANAYYFVKNYSEAFSLIKGIGDYSFFEENKIDVYRFLGLLCERLDKFSDAIAYFELSNKKIHYDVTETAEKEAVFNNWVNEGDCFLYNGNYYSAAEKYRMAAMLFGMIHNVDFAYLQRDSKNRLKKNEKSFRNDDIDYVLAQLFYCNERSGTWDTEGFLFEITAMARAGNKYATKRCNDAGINPYSDAWK